MKKTRTKEFCMAGMLAACTAVLAQIVIPIGPVPFNLAVFGAFLAGMLLSPGMAVLSMATYWLMAAIGLPVMAGLQGGLGAVLSPTGGYMAGYLLLAGCTALVAERPMPMRLAAGNGLVYLCNGDGAACCFVHVCPAVYSGRCGKRHCCRLAGANHQTPCAAKCIMTSNKNAPFFHIVVKEGSILLF